jgi:hypothetical protein
MSERPTQETDAKKWIEVGYNSYVVSATFAQKLERERNEARDQAQQMLESNQVLMADVRFYRNAWEQLKEGAK